MFNRGYIKHLKDEISYLREQNRNYQRMIIALKDKTVEYNTVHYKNTENQKTILDTVKEKEAISEQDKKEKKVALEQLRELGLA